MTEFSDYIVYVDESGDHSLTSIDDQFPVFALSFCIFAKAEYTDEIVPAVQAFKFKYWGYDSVILHEHEIRKSKNDFTFLLTNKAQREAFYADLHDIMSAAPMTIIGSVIDKVRLKEKYVDPWSPYAIALHFCLERLNSFLLQHGQDGKQVHIVFECRGRAEDDDLELTFRRIISGENQWGYRNIDFSKLELVPKFAKKSVNSTGLQLADLTARPMALKTLRPEQDNRAYDVIQTKLFARKEFP